ncbi:hypothetical protein Q5P01_013407 [Channa striata]|uniref:Uncharacterized protein n=1 Tax=Channa striata TaxID=64152 RepID=A0AA88SHQ2_CHASR|nr:hypothetical protein Q5P01_013407 [Channa striata]
MFLTTTETESLVIDLEPTDGSGLFPCAFSRSATKQSRAEGGGRAAERSRGSASTDDSLPPQTGGQRSARTEV